MDMNKRITRIARIIVDSDKEFKMLEKTFLKSVMNHLTKYEEVKSYIRSLSNKGIYMTVEQIKDDLKKYLNMLENIRMSIKSNIEFLYETSKEYDIEERVVKKSVMMTDKYLSDIKDLINDINYCIKELNKYQNLINRSINDIKLR